jgi:hypothetical protein
MACNYSKVDPCVGGAAGEMVHVDEPLPVPKI